MKLLVSKCKCIFKRDPRDSPAWTMTGCLLHSRCRGARWEAGMNGNFWVSLHPSATTPKSPRCWVCSLRTWEFRSKVALWPPPNTVLLLLLGKRRKRHSRLAFRGLGSQQTSMRIYHVRQARDDFSKCLSHIISLNSHNNFIRSARTRPCSGEGAEPRVWFQPQAFATPLGCFPGWSEVFQERKGS